MTRTSIVTLAALGLFVSACSQATAQPRTLAASSACGQLGNTQPVLDAVYGQGGVHSVKAVKKQVFLARAIQPTRTVGADMYVHARPDLSEAYLERVLTCHAAQGNPIGSNDPLHPASGAIADLNVRTVGSSLAVRVTAEDPKTGREIYERASSLSGGSSVTVEQLAQADSSGATF